MMHHHHHSPARHVRFQLLDKENNQSQREPRTPAPASSPTSKTPQSGSKLLRQHFSQISLTPRRLLDSGAVRVASVPKLQQKLSPQRRMGYDGTPYTPSKQLLQSTAASRNQQVHHQQVHFARGDEDQATPDKHDAQDHSEQHRIHRADFDPVASTLLRRHDGNTEEPPKNVFTGDLQDFSGVVHRPVATKLPPVKERNSGRC